MLIFKIIIRIISDDLRNIIKDNNLGEKVIKYFNKNYSYEDICNLLLKKYHCQISLRTLKRFLKENNLKRKNIEESPLEEIVAAINIELENSGFNLGYKFLWQRLLKEYNLIVKQKTVLYILQKIDPEGIAQRKRNRLRRRIYSVAGPNFLWHTDGYDKIKRYGFAIHGCIDGYSKKFLWLEVASTNNDPHVIAYYYLQTVKKFNGLPTILRSDKGTENSVIGELQQCLRYAHNDEYARENSYISGKSTANQRIEASWGQLSRHVTGFYINLFKIMEENELVDISNPLHLECLRYAFGPLIKHDFQTYKKEWNQHHIRKQNARNIPGGKPNVMFNLPQKFGLSDCKKPVDLEHVDILFQKYTTKPQLYRSEFEDVIKEVQFNPPVYCTVEDANDVYIELLKLCQCS